MKNYKTLLVLLIVTSIFIFTFFFFKFSNLEILLFLLNIGNSNYLILYFVLSVLYFISPLPIIFIVLLNGYLFNNVGFVYSLAMILLGSTILFFLSSKINVLLDINIKKFFKKKKIDMNKILQNKYSIFFSRFLIPYFLHNIYYGIQGVKYNKFIFYVLLSELPLVFCINSIGNSLSFFSLNGEISFFKLIVNENFYIPFILIFFIVLLSNYIKTKFLKNNK